MASKSVLKRLEKVEREVALLRLPEENPTPADLRAIAAFEREKSEGKLIPGEQVARELRGVRVGRRVQ